MDPEERLWFLEQAVEAFVTHSTDSEDLAVVDMNDFHQYVWLFKRLGGIEAAVGSRERFCRRPLSPQAVAKVSELGFQQDAVMGDFIREGLPANSVMLSRLVERLFLCAYELAPDYAVRASFKNVMAAESLEALMHANG